MTEPITVPVSAKNGNERRPSPWSRDIRDIMPGRVKPRRRGLHDVDDQRDDEHRHQAPVRTAERRVLGRRDDDVLRSGELAAQCPSAAGRRRRCRTPPMIADHARASCPSPSACRRGGNALCRPIRNIGACISTPPVTRITPSDERPDAAAIRKSAGMEPHHVVCASV